MQTKLLKNTQKAKEVLNKKDFGKAWKLYSKLAQDPEADINEQSLHIFQDGLYILTVLKPVVPPGQAAKFLDSAEKIAPENPEVFDNLAGYYISALNDLDRGYYYL
jgi:hypothetical protein